MGVARGKCTPFCQFYKKDVLRLSEHADVIETQTIRYVMSLPKFFSKLGPCPVLTPDHTYRIFFVQEVTILLKLPQAIKRKFSIECFRLLKCFIVI